MCGVVGELKSNSATEPKADWAKVSAMMARRKPDDKGISSDEERGTLVFRRLAIIELSLKGHQPMTACNGCFVLVFNRRFWRDERKGIRDQRKTMQLSNEVFSISSEKDGITWPANLKW